MTLSIIIEDCYAEYHYADRHLGWVSQIRSLCRVSIFWMS